MSSILSIDMDQNQVESMDERQPPIGKGTSAANEGIKNKQRLTFNKDEDNVEENSEIPFDVDWFEKELETRGFAIIPQALSPMDVCFIQSMNCIDIIIFSHTHTEKHTLSLSLALGLFSNTFWFLIVYV